MKKNKKEKKFPLRPISTNWYYALKILAIILMIPNFLIICSPVNTMFSTQALIIMRMISRASMPIFAYELVECFHYTKSRKKHLLKLFLLAVISEPLRDFVADSTLSNARQQSICYDFFLAWIMLMFMSADLGKLFKGNLLFKSEKYTKMLNYYHKVITGLVFSLIAEITMANYGFLCVALTALLEIAYNSKHKRIWQTVFLLIYITTFNATMVFQIFIVFDIILIITAETKFRKTGQEKPTAKFIESKPVKWICTTAYPLQLLIFTVIKLIIG